MVGQPDAAWNLELVGDPEDETPASPTKRTCWFSASVVTSGQRYPRQAGARPCKSGPVTREQQETGPQWAGRMFWLRLNRFAGS